MQPDESLWPDTRGGRGITSGTFYARLRCYLKNAGLPSGGVQIFRHSAARLRCAVGETVEDVSRFLDHSSLAVTTTYLRRLEGQEDQSWAKVAEGDRGLVCDAPPIQFHQLQAVCGRRPRENVGCPVEHGTLLIVPRDVYATSTLLTRSRPQLSRSAAAARVLRAPTAAHTACR